MTWVGLAVRNAFRNRFRTTLTVLGTAIAVVAFVLLRTLVASWEGASDYAARDRIATRNKISFVVALPRRYADTIREVPGVLAATWMNWYGGKDPRNPRLFFANFAVDARSFLDVYDELVVDPEARARWLEDRQGVLVGEALARKLELSVGDPYVLQGTVYPGQLPLRVAGIYRVSRKSFDARAMLFHWQYLDGTLPRQRREQIGWVSSRVDPRRGGADVSRAIDRTFDSRESPTLTMSERALNLSFLGMFSAILTAVDVVSLIILVVLLLILANTVAMGVRERVSEYGVLLAVGFKPRHIRAFILGEATTVGAMAGALGLGIAVPLVDRGVARFVNDNMGSTFPSFQVTPGTMALALGFACLLGAASGVAPAVTASRLSVVDALRRVG